MTLRCVWNGEEFLRAIVSRVGPPTSFYEVSWDGRASFCRWAVRQDPADGASCSNVGSSKLLFIDALDGLAGLVDRSRQRMNRLNCNTFHKTASLFFLGPSTVRAKGQSTIGIGTPVGSVSRVKNAQTLPRSNTA